MIAGWQGKDAYAMMAYFRASGFTALGSGMPSKEAPRDWLVWHFTHEDNLPGIVSSGHLCSQALSKPVVNVANQEVKARRESILVAPEENYPSGRMVADHVPFYIAAKSPMLYAVTHGHQDYRGGAEPLVFLGVSVGAIVDSGLTWCMSDANAATDYVRFSRELDRVGEFVDFDLLCQQRWGKSQEDPYRSGRRAAELLVLDRVPLEMISHVVAKTQVKLDVAHSALASVGGMRQYRVERMFYYD